jgi:hypothetical protein
MKNKTNNEGGIIRSPKSTFAIPQGLKPRSFQVPEGTYPATMIPPKVYENSEGEEGVRLRWEVDSKPGDREVYEVAKTYWPGELSLLLSHLSEITGGNVQTVMDEAGNLDLERLKGLRAEITVTHFHGDGYEHPFCNITAVKPLGTTVAIQTHGKKVKEDHLAELREQGGRLV